MAARNRGFIWKHKKYGAREYRGSYPYVDGERLFVLSRVLTKPKDKKHNVTFESHEAAKGLGWVKK